MADLNDSLSNLFDGDTGPVRVEPIRTNAVEYKPATARFEEGCDKCKGTGNFTSWSGRVVGQCFACKGAGKKVFKTSPMTREQNRERSAERKAANAGQSMVDFAAAHPDVHEWLKAETAKAAPFAFAVSMVEAICKYGDLTDKQLATCYRLAAKAKERIAQRATAVTSAPSVDVSAIETAFANARSKAARPGQMGIMVKPLKLAAGPSKEDIAFKVSPGSIGSQWEGQVFFKSIDGDRKLGYVKDGRFVRQFACTDAEAQAVVTVASNPKEGLIAYAKAWSKCGVCGRGLLNDESIERGIGPICFAKLGF
jgi:hypothetical protein